MLTVPVKLYQPSLNWHDSMDHQLLDSLSKEALIKIAEAYECFARRARARVIEISERERNLSHISDRLNILRSSGHQMAKMLNQYEKSTAEKILAKRYDCPVETIAYHYKKFLRANDAASVRARHMMITRLAARGYRNREIAQRTGMHEVSISRILRPILRPSSTKKGA